MRIRSRFANWAVVSLGVGLLAVGALMLAEFLPGLAHRASRSQLLFLAYPAIPLALGLWCLLGGVVNLRGRAPAAEAVERPWLRRLIVAEIGTVLSSGFAVWLLGVLDFTSPLAKVLFAFLAAAFFVALAATPALVVLALVHRSRS
jgi:hypothetical protein